MTGQIDRDYPVSVRSALVRKRKTVFNLKFSLLELFALSFLVALILVLYRSVSDWRSEYAQLIKLRKQVTRLESRIPTQNSLAMETYKHAWDDAQVVNSLRDKAVAKLEELSDRYSEIIPQPDSKFIIRRVPTLGRRKQKYPWQKSADEPASCHPNAQPTRSCPEDPSWRG